MQYQVGLKISIDIYNKNMLTQEERDYLFSKLEYTKKKKIVADKNDIYQMLRGDVELNEEGFIKILNSLEYTFKKILRETESNIPIIKSIQSKLPEVWLGVKFSSLAAHTKKIEKSKNENILSFDEFTELNS